jgi:hypothetical protein
MSYDVGDPAPLAVNTRDAAGALANAGAVACTVTLPDQTVTTPVVTNVSVGLYTAAYVIVQAGHHTVRWVATGANAAATTDSFDVRPPANPVFMSLDDARKTLKLPPADTSKDEMLRDYIDAVAGVIEDFWGAVVPRVWSEQHQPGVSTISLNHQPVIAVTAVTEYRGATPFTVTQVATPDVATAFSYTFDPPTGTLERRTSGGYPMPWYGEVWITYTAGCTVIPGNVILAGRELLRQLWQNGQQAGRPQLGAIPGDDAVFSPSGYAVTRRIAELLGDPRKAPGFA